MRLPFAKSVLVPVALLAVLLLLALAACGEEEEEATPAPGETPGAEETPSPAAGNIYQTGMFEDITTSNYWSANGPDATVYNEYVLGPAKAKLMRYADQRLDWVPDLAAEVPSELEQEGEFWVTTVTLKEGAVWSDGQPITAEDAVFTWHTVRDLEITDGNWASQVDLGFLDHAEAIDATTLKIFFKDKPGLAVWQFGLAMAPILPKHYWEPVVEEAKATGDPKATLYAHDASDAPGAMFSFARREAGAFVENAANSDFYRKGQAVKEYENGAYTEEGRYPVSIGDPTGATVLEFETGPHVDSTIYNVYADQDSALLAMQEGEFDFWLNPLGLSKGLQEQLEATEGIDTITNGENGFKYLGFNFRKPPLDDPAYRQAVAILIDKEFVCAEILQGQCMPGYSLVPEANGFWYNSDTPRPGEGLDREQRVNDAKTIMKEAGYTWETEPEWDPEGAAVRPTGQGLKDPSGNPVPEFRLSVPSAGYDPLRSTFGLWIGTWLNEFGIPVKVETFGFNVLASKIFDEQDIDMWILGWGLDPFASHMSAFFDSREAELGGFNAGGYSNPEFDALVDQFNAETDLDAALEIAKQQQAFLAEDPPYVVLFSVSLIEAYRSATIGYPYTEVLDGIQSTGTGFSGLPYGVRAL